jgi:SAM-dependent methyltransferase
MSEWFEDESFWIDLYPFMFSDERIKIAEEQVEQALTLTGFQGGAVLDLCCGSGRHSVELAKRGIQVIAIDRTKFLLDKAKEKATELGLQIEFILDDMRHFIRPGAFALVLNLFTSFGYFDNKEDDFQVLQNIYESLRTGGTLLIDIVGKELVARKLQPTTSSKLLDGSLLVECHEVFDDWSRIRNEWILIKDETAKSYKFHHTIYSGQELKNLLHKAGFESVRLFGDLAGSEYGLEAKRLVAVARKAF